MFNVFLPSEELPVHPKFEPLDGLCAVDGAWQIELPRNTAILELWGEQLNHYSVGGYGSKIQRGNCVIFGVRVNNSLAYIVEMLEGEEWHCVQFYGLDGQEPPFRLRSNILDMLCEALYN